MKKIITLMLALIAQINLSVVKAANDYVPTIYGNIINMSSWGARSDQDKPYGVYSFSASPTNFEFKNVSPTSLNFYATGNGLIANGEYNFVVRDFDYYSYDYYYQLYTYDTETWKLKKSPVDVDKDFSSCDFTQDPVSGKIYSTNVVVKTDYYGNVLSTKYNLNEVDFANVKLKVIASLDSMICTIAADNSGQLYGISKGENLYKISKTGELTFVGNLGLAAYNLTFLLEDGIHTMSSTFDPKTNILYLSAYCWNTKDLEFETFLFYIDTATGKATKVVKYPETAQVVSLYIPKPAADEEAPAAVSDLSVDFKNGALNGNVKFTVPTKTNAGEDLTGELTYKIVVANEVIATGKTQSGAIESVPVVVKNGGETKFIVTIANDKGDGVEQKVLAWIGYDITQAPSDVKLTIENHTAKVTWNAPTEVLHGGYIDSENLKYNVVRYPDNVVVAENVGNTEYEDGLNPTEMTSYTYGVQAVNGNQKSEINKSNAFADGPTFTVPYYNALESKKDFETFVSVDVNGDKKYSEMYGYVIQHEGYWDYNNAIKCVVYYESNQRANDWFVSPLIHFEGGKTYNVIFDSKREVERFQERLAIAYGESFNFDGYTTLVDSLNPQSGEYSTYKYSFTPSLTGDYHIGFHALSKNQGHLYLKNIKVELVEQSATGISALQNEDNEVADIYTLQGVLVRRQAYSFAGLPKGVYIKNGKKFVVR